MKPPPSIHGLTGTDQPASARTTGDGRADDPVQRPGRAPAAAAPHPSGTPGLLGRTGHLTQIDALKGLAIVGVMAQHAFASQGLRSAWDTLYAGQAVPVFFILMGLNAAVSLMKVQPLTLRRLYTPRYLAGRFDRLLLPFLVLWPVAAVAAVATGQFHVGPLALVGVFPIAHAPGNYFVTIVIEFALLFPLVFWCFEQAPVATSLVIVGLDVAFELAAAHVSFFTTSSSGAYIYEAVIAKYAVFILAGVWLTRLRLTRGLWALLTAAAAGSLVYLVLLHQNPHGFTWLVDSFSRSTNFLSVFYAVWLVCLALRFLPDHAGGRAGAIVESLGQASYHIFLVQIIWFGAISNRTWPVAVVGMVACSLIGWAFAQIPMAPLHRRLAARTSAT